MSGRHGPIEGLWWRLVDRIASIDRERLSVAVVAAGAVLAVAAVLLGGYAPLTGSALVGLLYVLAVLFPALGGLLAIGALWRMRSGDRAGPPPMRWQVPEEGVTRTERPVGRETAWSVETAASARYRCRVNESAEDVRNRLVEGAVRVVTTRRGLEAETARERVQSGTWTDDPIAAAFLADDRPHPLGERLRAAADPGAAYRRRVRRTLEAIEAIDEGSSPLEEREVDR